MDSINEMFDVFHQHIYGSI